MLLFPEAKDGWTIGASCSPLSLEFGLFGNIHPAVVPSINRIAGPAAVGGESFLPILPPLVGADLAASSSGKCCVKGVMKGFLRASLQQTFGL